MQDLTHIEALGQPALVIDTNIHELCEANTLGRRMWGLPDAQEMPVALNPEMPAMRGLREHHPGEFKAELVFWTLHGAQRVRCSVQRLSSNGTVLVVICDPRNIPHPQVTPTEGVLAADLLARPTDATGGIQQPPSNPANPASHSSPDIRSMAHELRTPLGAIIALAEMIEREQFGKIGDPRYVAYARDIRDSARLTLGIVASALETDRPDDEILLGGYSETNADEVIRKCLRTVRLPAEAAGVSLVRDIPENLPNLIANGPGLNQILLNLLSNAIKFTPQGGRITVTAVMTSDGCLMITVSDTGLGMTGIDTDILTANGNDTLNGSLDGNGGPNRGIGFSLVRRLCAAMEATLHIASTRGTGTRISVTFPPTKVIPVGSATVEV